MKNVTGKSVWFAIPVNNLLDAMSFYEALLGWEFVQMKDSPELDYVMVQSGGTLIGGLRMTKTKIIANQEFSAPLLYFTVDELEPKILRAKELGAQIVGEKVDLKNGRGFYQRIKDRENNWVALWAPK